MERVTEPTFTVSNYPSSSSRNVASQILEATLQAELLNLRI